MRERRSRKIDSWDHTGTDAQRTDAQDIAPIEQGRRCVGILRHAILQAQAVKPSMGRAL